MLLIPCCCFNPFLVPIPGMMRSQPLVLTSKSLRASPCSLVQPPPLTSPCRYRHSSLHSSGRCNDCLPLCCSCCPKATSNLTSSSRSCTNPSTLSSPSPKNSSLTSTPAPYDPTTPRLGWVPLSTSTVPSAHLRMALINGGCFGQLLCHIFPCRCKPPGDTDCVLTGIFMKGRREREKFHLKIRNL